MKRYIFVIRQAFGTVLVRSSTQFERGYTERIVCEEYEKGECKARQIYFLCLQAKMRLLVLISEGG